MNNFLLICFLGLCLKKNTAPRELLYDSGNGRGYRSYKHTAFSRTALLGASGVVFMFILLSSFVNLKGKNTHNLYTCCYNLSGRRGYERYFVKDNISQLAHLVGGICGSVFGFKWAERSSW